MARSTLLQPDKNLRSSRQPEVTGVGQAGGRIQFPLFDVSVRPLLTASSHGDATAPTIPCDDAVRHFPSRRCRVKFVVKGLLINVVEGI